MTIEFDVLGLGNAIMDIITPVSDDNLASMSITKGAMTLIDQATALSLTTNFDALNAKTIEVAGGSAANTIVGIAGFGLRTGYIGKVADDALGQRFASGMRETGVAFDTKPLVGGEATARCLVAVTPDGERSMSTFLGASVEFGKEDVVKDLIEHSRILYLEGYLFDKPAAKEAFIKAAEIAQAAGRKVAFTLSDAFCVDRHRESFKHLVDNHVDIVFANEAELLSLYETDDFDAALDMIRQQAETACITRSEKGSIIVTSGDTFVIPVCPVDKVVDTTGAGDQYAAGVLAGHAKGMSWADAGYLGSKSAAEVISHYGARPERKID